MPRYFYDTEFIEDGKTIDLISIGIVCEDGRELYLQSVEFDSRQASQWVKENVLSHLILCPSHSQNTFLSEATRKNWVIDWAYHNAAGGQCCTGGINSHCLWRTREQIKNELLAFMNVEKYGKPELWAYYADYDHVALCQIFGTMMDLPKDWPMYTLDLKQFCFHVGNPRLAKHSSAEHNALEDARHNKVMYEFIAKYAQELNDEVARALAKYQRKDVSGIHA